MTDDADDPNDPDGAVDEDGADGADGADDADFRPSDPYGRYRQVEVYTTGMLTGERPDIPIRPDDLREQAMDHLSEEAYTYVAGSAGGEDTARANREAFRRWRLVPRMLRDVETRDLHVDLFGRTCEVPFVLAPIGVQSIIHEDGELATARAAADLDIPMAVSTASSSTLEDVADELGSTPKWFQLYWSTDRAVTESLVDRAADAGYDALVVTVDTPLLGWRERDVERAYLPFLDGEGVANYFADPAFRDSLASPPEDDEQAAIQQFIDVFGDPSLTFEDLGWLCEYADLPVVVKGLLHADDATRAIEVGAEGVVVSNHGGRQVDGAIAALDALPDVVDAVGDRGTVLFDSGIRRASDALKAIALGADAVLVGRPYVYGLAIDGADGVRAVCENLRADLDLTLALTGHRRVADVDRDCLVESPSS